MCHPFSRNCFSFSPYLLPVSLDPSRIRDGAALASFQLVAFFFVGGSIKQTIPHDGGSAPSETRLPLQLPGDSVFSWAANRSTPSASRHRQAPSAHELLISGEQKAEDEDKLKRNLFFVVVVVRVVAVVLHQTQR